MVRKVWRTIWGFLALISFVKDAILIILVCLAAFAGLPLWLVGLVAIAISAILNLIGYGFAV